MLKTANDAATGGRKITFTLPDGPDAVSVVGNFNDWTPGVTPLRRRGSSRSASVVVPRDYIAVFRYLGEGGRWFDEPAATFVDAGASVLLPPAAKPASQASSKAKAPTKAKPRASAAKAEARTKRAG